MIKKIFCFIACFMLVLSCVFISPITANASTGQTYIYDDSEVYSDTSNLGNYAIDSIESLTVNGSQVRKVTISINSNITFRFLNSTSSSAGEVLGNYFFCNFSNVSNSQLNINFAIRCLTSSVGLTYYYNGASQGSINGTTYYRRALQLEGNNTYEFYFSLISFGGTFDNMTFGNSSIYNLSSEVVFDSSNVDLASFVDMDSETSISLSVSDFDLPGSLLGYDLASYFSKIPFGLLGTATGKIPTYSRSVSQLASFSPVDSLGAVYRGSSLQNELAFKYMFQVETSANYTEIEPVSLSFYFSDFYFKINRPVFRTNNTLIIYNYNYSSFLSAITSTTYQLQKGVDKYNVVYNGFLPNSYFIYVHNKHVANIIFDEYIYLYFNSSAPFFISENDFNIPLGFDFNFTYYNEPLVSSNGSYNFDFEKPGYVDMRFSLSPFYIPILEAVQNALIFLLFYCPIISDILSFIHLDQFFGAIFNIFGFSNNGITLLGINLGSFIWACISFLIFFKLLRSFMPILWSSGKEVYSDLTYNSRTYKAEIANEKKKESYKKYKDKKNKKNQN